GFTLVELLIVVAVVALAAAAVAPAVGSLTGANARKAAGEMAGAMRWLFDTAALRHTTCRLALDLDGSAFWAECVDPAKGRGPAVGGRDDDEVLADRFPEEKSREVRRFLARSPFGEFSDRTVKRRALPGGAELAEVWTPRLDRPVEKGIAHVYFFPRGQAEAARVVVGTGDHLYSVTLEPLTGRARVVAGKPELPR
ncbi:MAG TPA: prepilin-type N-terminal cleavage/methylation domain-containing protein, partial [Anaeromyxobacteraceae bacterium]|nr:prepilin-type N-terminal cleavage/methylation domain-containing protein [Anaeromyxobacteraceae bacterium]